MMSKIFAIIEHKWFEYFLHYIDFWYKKKILLDFCGIIFKVILK